MKVQDFEGVGVSAVRVWDSYWPSMGIFLRVVSWALNLVWSLTFF